MIVPDEPLFNLCFLYIAQRLCSVRIKHLNISAKRGLDEFCLRVYFKIIIQ